MLYDPEKGKIVSWIFWSGAEDYENPSFGEK